MGATFGELQQLLDQALGTSETNLINEDMRKTSINRAIREILTKFDVSVYMNEQQISFGSGISPLPTDCLRPYWLGQPDNQIEYIRVDPTDFMYNVSYTYKTYWNAALSARYLKIYPANSINLTLFYIQNPDPLVEDTDEVRFDSWWNDAIAEMAAYIALNNVRNYAAAALKKETADDMMSKSWQNERQFLVGPQQQRMTSVFEKSGMFGDFLMSLTPFTITEMADGLTWVTVTDTAASGTANTGFVTDNVARVQITLPVYAEVGDAFQVNGKGSGGWRITQIAGQRIIFGNATTTTGASGYMESSLANDVVGCRFLGSNIWEVSFSVGNITLV